MVYLINVAARLLGLILRIDHGLEKQFKTIVVSKYVGIGSIIQATPLIQTLRNNYPSARIIFVSAARNGGIIKHIPEVNETKLIDDKNIFSVIRSTFSLLLDLWNEKPDLFIDLEFYSNYSSIVTTLSMATNRLGFYKHNKPYRRGVYNYLVPFNVDFPISETYLQYAGLLGFKHPVRTLKLEVLNENFEDSIFKKTDLSADSKYIVVNPNASDLRIERRWPKESYVQLINSILDQYPAYKIVLIGNKLEADYVSEIVSEIPEKNRLIDSSAKLNLSELIFLISKAYLMISNDTGPMHIAFAVNTRTVALFGPCSPMQYGQMQNGVTFYKKVPCSPCVHKYLTPPCHGDNICMKRISVDEVKQAVFQNIQ